MQEPDRRSILRSGIAIASASALSVPVAADSESENRPNTSDISMLNLSDDEQRLTVELRNQQGKTVHKEDYTVPSGESRDVQSVETRGEGLEGTVDVEGGTTDSVRLPNLTRNPNLYGLRVEFTPAEGLVAGEWHLDPISGGGSR